MVSRNSSQREQYLLPSTWRYLRWWLSPEIPDSWMENLLPFSPPLLPQAGSFSVHLVNPHALCTVIPSSAGNRARPSRSRCAAGSRMAFCRHCDSRSGLRRCAMLVALLFRSSAEPKQAFVSMSPTLNAGRATSPPQAATRDIPGLQSRWQWSRSGSIRRMSSA